MAITKRFSDFANGLRLEDLPDAVVAKARLLILDTIGVAIGSSALDFGRQALALATEWPDDNGNSLIGRTQRVAPHHAAMINGILAHGQDYDDTHTESVVHSSGALVPAMLACAERDKVSGAVALTAFVAATEMSLRLALPARNAFHLGGFHTTSVACTFGTALMSSMTAGRSQDQLLQALGICGSFASGLLECVPAASSAKRLHAGWAGLCGIIAADLARVGFTGPSTVIEGRLGLYNSMLRGQSFDFEEMFADIGTRWHLLDIRPKLYPCCHYLQAFIDCAARLRTEPGFDLSRITTIHARVAAGSVNMICEPWAFKIAPKTGYDARFSLAYAIGTMLVRGRAGHVEFHEDSLNDPVILDLMSKVSYEIDPSYTVKDMPGLVAIEYDDGRTSVESLAAVRGDAEQPISAEELLSKFYDCTAGFDRAQAKWIAERVMSFEKGESVSDLTHALASIAPR